MIAPRIDVSGGRAVRPALAAPGAAGEAAAFTTGRAAAGCGLVDAGDPLERLAAYALAGEVAVCDLDATRSVGSNRELIARMVRRGPCRVAGGIGDPEAARLWLDAGAHRVVLDTTVAPEEFSALPRERLVAVVEVAAGGGAGAGAEADGHAAAFTTAALLETVRRYAPFVGGVLLRLTGASPAAGGLDDALLNEVVVAAPGVRVVVAGGIAMAGEVARLDRLGADAEAGAALADGRLSLADAIAAPLPRGRGLWPTVVCDEGGAALGLAWSSLRSLRRAIADRRGVYWSRSRRQLWIKGATSGNTQTLLGVALDCDRDALRFTVRQEGTGFCHTGARSCWGDDFDLGALERIIRDRLTSPVEGSGTARLAADPDLLAAKLVEEARELAEADDRPAAVRETADLVYFALVALVGRGGRLPEVLAELERRHLHVSRRAMRAKPEAGR